LSAEAAAWPEIEVAIDRLDDCLSHADARSESEFARIRAMLMGQPLTDDKCQSMLNQIAELIDDLEYEPARAKLRLLRHVLGGQLT
jgi:hypothetical protein